LNFIAVTVSSIETVRFQIDLFVSGEASVRDFQLRRRDKGRAYDSP
jgi:hypothetical protein